MNDISALFQNRRNILGMLFLGVLVYTTFNIQENSIRLKKITNFEGGMQTCFSRVNQTYTAKLINEATSQYLTQNFESLTEECFAESIMNIDENFKSELASVTKKLTTLASNVHWFHEDLLSPSGIKSLTNSEGRDAGTRFEKIENTKDEVLEESELFKTNIIKELSSGRVIFFITSTLLVAMMLLEYFSNTKRKISNNAREIEAEGEMRDNGGIQSVKLGEIVRLALEQNQLSNCAKLFNNYYVNTNLEKAARNKMTNPLDALITPNATSFTESKKEEFIEEIWNDDSIGIVADTNAITPISVNLDQSLSRMIDVLSDKLFSKGVQVNIKVNENINIQGSEEVIEQVIYHSLNYAINSATKSEKGKIVEVSAIKLGDVTAVDISTTGAGKDNSLDLDLQITHSLVSDVNGKMQIDNRIDQIGTVIGCRIKLILKSANSEATSRLIALKKGSKKDILKSISETYI